MTNIFSLQSYTPSNAKAWDKLFDSQGGGSRYTKAGVTYLAQMLAHEIVGSKRHDIRRSMLINMESLYDGHRPKDSELNQYLTAKGLFTLGNARGANDQDIHGADLPLDPNKSKADIADIRNDENLFVSQLHLLWMKFHNQLMRDDDRSENVGIPADLNKIRASVTIIFKLVIINDVLNTIIHPKVLSAYRALKDPTILLMHDHNYKEVPNIFAHAAFRFGHSMVRNCYTLKPDRCHSASQRTEFTLKLNQILNHRSGTNQHGRKDTRVSEDMLFDWDSLFGFGDLAVKAMRIDAAIARDMQKIPGRGRDIASMNLAANDQHCLPAAPQLFAELTEAKDWMTHMSGPLGLDEFHPHNIKITDFTEEHQHNNLPFWLYVLCEACDISNHFDDEYGENRGGGNNLGILGSIIVLEVIIQALGKNGKDYFWFQYAQDEASLVSALPTLEFKSFLNDYGVTRINSRHIIDYLKHCKKNEVIRDEY